MGLRTAKAWGLTPREWREQSPDDRALMMGLDLFEGTLEGYRAEWREDRRKAKGGDAKNEFEDLKRRMKLK